MYSVQWSRGPLGNVNPWEQVKNFQKVNGASVLTAKANLSEHSEVPLVSPNVFTDNALGPERFFHNLFKRICGLVCGMLFHVIRATFLQLLR